jgi:hypothetical protein
LQAACAPCGCLRRLSAQPIGVSMNDTFMQRNSTTHMPWCLLHSPVGVGVDCVRCVATDYMRMDVEVRTIAKTGGFELGPNFWGLEYCSKHRRGH